MASFALNKRPWRMARCFVQASITSFWAVVILMSLWSHTVASKDAILDWLGLSLSILLAATCIPEGDSSGLWESPPGKLTQIALACAIFMATLLAGLYPRLGGLAKDPTCSYWYHQDLQPIQWGEEKRRFNRAVFWTDTAMCIVVAFIAIACVLKHHPPSSFTRCAVRFICSIWLESLLFSIVGQISLCADPRSKEMSFTRSVGRSLAMYLNATNMLWVSVLILRRMKAFDMAMHCAVSPRHRQRRSSHWMKPLLVGYGLMNVTQFAAVVCAMVAMQDDSYGAYQSPGAILHTVTAVCLMLLTVALWHIFRRPLQVLESEAKTAGPIPGGEARWAWQNLRHERNMILLSMLLTTADITVRSIVGFCPTLQRTLAGIMTVSVTWDVRNCTDAATMAALCGLVLTTGKDKEAPSKQCEAFSTAPHPSSTDPAWAAKVEELAGRGFRLAKLLDFLECLLDGSIMPSFNPELSTTNDVVRQAIIPESRDKEPLEGGKALATVWSGGEPVWPARMVTHTWANLFLHLVAAVVADALQVDNYFEDFVQKLCTLEGLQGIRTKLAASDRLGLSYWVCAFSVNQHAGICGGFGPPPPEGTSELAEWERKRRDGDGRLHPVCTCKEPKYFNDNPVECEMNKFDDMIALLIDRIPEFTQVIAVDAEFGLLRRCWCLAEIVKTASTATPQNTLIHSCDAMDLHYGLLSTLDVRQCQASHKEDKEFILRKIPDKDAFNARLQWLIFSKRGIFMQQKRCPRDRVDSAGRITARIYRARTLTSSPGALVGLDLEAGDAVSSSEDALSSDAVSSSEDALSSDAVPSSEDALSSDEVLDP